ncbi:MULTISPECIES: response regulator transcription factor [Flavobacterium]|uniref:LytR/AlgR family response regulator transcription factor n=1 Tax=Flavobacterium TaxID=237 RepID=UPI00095B907E|nr:MULTISPECIES: response regulator transcription factor [Flavobacterium]MBN9283889.1 response regulator transcription factor [Flavobacterium sp.]OJV68614.1 MAG: two-component system response regulator [Flavobacterium sp. 40-81]
MSTKLKCLLLDDELPGLTYLKMLCEQIPELEVVRAFNNPETFLAECREYEFDVLISDIEMPGMNGLQVANLLQDKAVIFTTAYKDFAVEAYELDAVDYVVKPIKKERLQQAVQKVLKRVESSAKTVKKHLQLNTDKGKAILPIEQIFFIKSAETDSRDKIIYLQDLTKLVAKNYSFDKLLKQLPAEEFCRVNKKEALAIKNIQFYSHDEITASLTASNGKPFSFSLSESYRSEFLEKVKI